MHCRKWHLLTEMNSDFLQFSDDELKALAVSIITEKNLAQLSDGKIRAIIETVHL